MLSRVQVIKKKSKEISLPVRILSFLYVICVTVWIVRHLSINLYPNGADFTTRTMVRKSVSLYKG